MSEFDWSVLHGVDIPYGAVGQVYVACPNCSSDRKRGGKTLSIHMEKGVWFCHYCRFSGSVAPRKEYDTKDYTWNLTLFPSKKSLLQTPEPKQTSLPVPETQGARDRLIKMWKQSKPLSENDMVVRYLSNRKVLPDPPWPRVLRYHPSLLYLDKEGDEIIHKANHPAMLALIHDTKGTAVAMHRTYLSSDGSGKADVPMQKKMTAPVYPRATMGGAVRLSEAAEELGVAEGIETALSVMKYTGMSCWAGLSAGHMAVMEFPDIVKRVVIWADNDTAGIRSANQLGTRMKARQIDVKIVMPPEPGTDWADL